MSSTAMDSAIEAARVFAQRAATAIAEGWAWLSLSSSAQMAAAAAGPLGEAMAWVSTNHRALLLCSFVGLCALIYYLSAHVRRPHCTYAHTDFNLWMMRQLPRLQRAYWPTFYLTHEVPQAAVGSFVRFNPRVRKDPGFQREILKMEDGEHIALDWLHPLHNKGKKAAGSSAHVAPAPVPESEDTTPIAFTCHGLAGHTDELNMQYLGLEIRRLSGARFAIMNRRGCAHDMVLQNETIYLWGCTADLKETLAHIKRRFPKAPLLGIGLSAGSNLLTKYLGETGLDSLFDAGFSVANSFDVGSTSRALHAKPFYANIMVSILLDLLNRNLATFKKIQQRQEIEAQHHEKTRAEMKQQEQAEAAAAAQAASSRSRPPALNLARVRKIKSVLEWDEHFTMLTHAHRGFKSLDEFYHAQSTTPDLIANISVPLLNLHALDDPILPAKRALDYTRALESNSHVILATTIRGGHLGFTEGLWPFNKATWLETLAAEWVRAMTTPEALEKMRALRRRDREAKEEIRLAERERRIAAEKEKLKAELEHEEESKSNGRSHHPVRPRSPVLHPNPNQPPLQHTHNQQHQHQNANLNQRHSNGTNNHSHSHQLELPSRQGSACPQQKWNQQTSRRSKSPSPAAAAANGHSHRASNGHGHSHGHTAAAAAGSLDFSFGTDDLGIGPIATYLPSPTESPPAASAAAADTSSSSQESSYSLADYASLSGESSQPPVMHPARSDGVEDDDDDDEDDVAELPDASPFVPATPFAHPHGFVAAAAVASYPDAAPSPTPSTPPVASPVVSQSIVSVMSVSHAPPRTASPMLPTQETMDYEHQPEDADAEAPSPRAAAGRGRTQPAWKSGAAAAAAAAGPQQTQSRSQKRPVSAAHAASPHAPAATVPASPAKRRRSDASSADAAPSSPSSRPSRTTSRTSSTPNKKKN